AKSLECSAKEPAGVWGVERSEGGRRNWGSPPRPPPCRPGEGAGVHPVSPGKSPAAGRVADRAVVATEGAWTTQPRPMRVVLATRRAPPSPTRAREAGAPNAS